MTFTIAYYEASPSSLFLFVFVMRRIQDNVTGRYSMTAILSLVAF